MISAKQTSYLLCAVAISVIFLISFRAFAPFLSQNLNSDNAVHILMAYHLKLPDDLYYWGQNRLGSVVPILSHLVLKAVPIPVVQAVSYVQYFLLLAGFVSFASLFKYWASRAIFAFAWFLPLQPLNELISIGQPYGAQLAFIGISLVLLDRLAQHLEPSQQRVRQLLITLAVAALFISLWVSDFSIVTILLLALTGLRYIYKHLKRDALPKNISIRTDIINVLVTSACGIAFIQYAKANSSGGGRYQAFNNLKQISEVVSTLAVSFFRTLTFRANDLFLSIHAILAVILLGYFSYLAVTSRQNRFAKSRWLLLFLGTAIVGFILLILSNWVYINNINLRYFTVVYIALWLSAIWFAETLQGSAAKRAYILLLAVALSSSLSLPDHVFSLEKHRSKIQQLQAFEQLGQAGFIGDYWSSYVLCSVNPALLNCTPYDRRGKTPCPIRPTQEKHVGRVRCSRCVPEVLASKTIYLVKEKWLDTFPEETQQFRHCLKRVGEPRRVARYTIAPYEISTKE